MTVMCRSRKGPDLRNEKSFMDLSGDFAIAVSRYFLKKEIVPKSKEKLR